MESVAIETYDVVNQFFVMKWNDGEESYIPLKRLRDECPCAECGGEKDVLGNIYGGYGRARGEQRYQLVGMRMVGYYAVQPTWADGHNTGIYRFELLKALGLRIDRRREPF